VVVVLEPASYAAGLRHERLQPGARLLLAPAELGPAWQRDPEDDTPPALEVVKNTLVVRGNGARLRKSGNSVGKDEDVVLQRGDHLDVGQARLSVAGIVHVKLRVRNAFGVEREHVHELSLPEVSERPSVEVVSVAEAQP